MIFANLRETLASGLATFDDARAAMITGYATLPFDQAPALRQLFAWLAEGNVPLIINCTADKDRTGVAAALVLAALGVPRNLIFEDYLHTKEVLGRERALVASPSSAGPIIAPEVLAAITTVERTYIKASFEEIDARHGTLAAYLQDELGMDGAAVEGIRAQLLV